MSEVFALTKFAQHASWAAVESPVATAWEGVRVKRKNSAKTTWQVTKIEVTNSEILRLHAIAGASGLTFAVPNQNLALLNNRKLPRNLLKLQRSIADHSSGMQWHAVATDGSWPGSATTQTYPNILGGCVTKPLTPEPVSALSRSVCKRPDRWRSVKHLKEQTFRNVA